MSELVGVQRVKLKKKNNLFRRGKEIKGNTMESTKPLDGNWLLKKLAKFILFLAFQIGITFN